MMDATIDARRSKHAGLCRCILVLLIAIAGLYPVRADAVDADPLETKLDAVEGKLDSMAADSTTQDTAIDALEGKMDALEMKADAQTLAVGAVESKSDSIEAKSDLIEGKLDSIALNIDAQDTAIDALETKADAQTLAVGAVETKSDAIEAKIDALALTTCDTSEIPALEAKADTMESKMDAMEAKLDALEAKLDTLLSRPLTAPAFSSVMLAALVGLLMLLGAQRLRRQTE